MGFAEDYFQTKCYLLQFTYRCLQEEINCCIRMHTESSYLELIDIWCIATEDMYAILLKAYCISALLEKVVFADMQKFGLLPS
jgi:hypothetical protein